MALLPYITAAIDPIANALSTTLTNKANMKLAQYQFDTQKEMWKMNNEYNTPSAQMERYNRAGLNPNLIYGQGTPGNSTSAPSYQAPRLEAPQLRFNLPEVLKQFQDIDQSRAQTDNINANTAVTTQKAITEGLVQQKILSDTNYTNVKSSTAQMLQNTQAEVLKANLNKLNQQIKNEQVRRAVLSNQASSIKEDISYKSWRNALNEKGVSASDALPYRVAAQVWDAIVRPENNTLKKNVVDFMKKFGIK